MNRRKPNDINLKLYLGTTFKETLKTYNVTRSGNIETTTAFDYTGYEAKMQVRSKKTNADALLTLSTGDYSITLSSGQIVLEVPKSTIGASSLTQGKYYYDIIITNDEGSFWHLGGTIDVFDNVTDV